MKQAGISSDAVKAKTGKRWEEWFAILDAAGAQSLPQIAVYNKIDRSGESPHVEFDAEGRVDRVWLSAHTGSGLELLRDALHRQLGADLHHCMLVLPVQAGRARAQLFEAGAVLAERLLGDGSVELEVNLRHRDVARICREAGITLPAAIEPCASIEPFLQSPGRAAADTAASAVSSGPDVPLIDRPQAIGSN